MTLERSLNSLFKQKIGPIEVIIVDDNSTDDSKAILARIDRIASENSFVVKVILKHRNEGLAATYNKGIINSSSDIIVLLHPDCVLLTEDSLARLIMPLLEKPSAVASHGCYLTPKDIWDLYPFWQKVLYSRWFGKKICKLDGKFDAFRKDALMRVGLFDSNRFRTAGEDRDIEIKLRSTGEIVRVDVLFHHLHQVGKKFTFQQLARKECQLAECYGALLRRWGKKVGSSLDVIRLLLRPLVLLVAVLIFALGVPYFLSLVFLGAVATMYSRSMFLKWDIKLLALPAINIAIFLLYTFFFAFGYVTGKQRL